MADVISLNNTNYKIDTSGISNTISGALKAAQTSKDTITLPTTQSNGNGKTSTGKSGSVGQVISDIASSANALVGSYGNLTSKVSSLTNGAIKLPTITSGSTIANILTGANTATDILGTLTSGQNGSRVQTNSVNVQPGAFKWVELETEPKEFVDYDSVLIFAGEPVYADNTKGTPFTPIGICQSFQVSTQLNITTVQELRCEEQLVIPGKTAPISVNISRLCGIWPNLINRLHGVQTQLNWNLSMQYTGARDLFGLYVMVLDTSRQNIVTQFYIERCAIQGFSLSLTAGNMGVLDNVSIIAGRIIDPTKIVATDTSTGNTTVTNGDVVATSDSITTVQEEETEEAAEEEAANEVVEEDKSVQVSGQGETIPESAKDGSGVADQIDIPTKEEVQEQLKEEETSEPQIQTQPVSDDNSTQKAAAEAQYQAQVEAEAVTKQQQINKAQEDVSNAAYFVKSYTHMVASQVTYLEGLKTTDPRGRMDDGSLDLTYIASQEKQLQRLKDKLSSYTTELSQAEAKLNALKGS